MGKGGGKRDDAKAVRQMAANVLDSQFKGTGGGGGEDV